MICPKCFNQNKDGSDYCGYCGSSFKHDNVVNNNGININDVIQTETKKELQQLSDDPFMNQVLNQELDDKEKPRFDISKYTNALMEGVKNLSNNKYVLLGVGCFGVVFVGILLFNIFHKPSELEILRSHPNYAESFFFKANEKKYALVSKEGKVLTEFIFDNAVNNFVGGFVEVNVDGDYAVLKDNGKYSIKPGKYDSLLDVGALYLVSNNSGSKYITANGKLVANSENYTVSYDASNEYLTALKDKNDNVVIYNYNGKKITTLRNKDKDLFMHSKDIYAVYYSDGKVTLMNAQSGNVITSFKSEDSYCINGINSDASVFTLNTCDDSWNFDKKNQKFKLIEDKRVVDIDDTCDEVSVQYDSTICIKDNKKYLLNRKDERSVSLDDEINYVDGENYAKMDGEEVVIYFKEKKVATVKDASYLSTGKNSGDAYLIQLDNGKYVYYDLEGKKLFDADYDQAYNFDKYDRAVVREDRDYFLVDKKGKKIAGPYYYIESYSSDIYVISNSEYKYGVIDLNGKKLLDVKYSSITPYTFELSTYLSIYHDGKHSLYSVKDKKFIIEKKDKLVLDTNYVKCEDGELDQYFTYNGQMFYEK